LSLKKFNLLEDIYYKKEYISLYLKPNEEIFEFKYEEDSNVFYNVSIKRAIEKIGNIKLDSKYYDLESVYGYGGIYSNTDDENFINKALALYRNRCKEENIISEFTRFHPFNTTHTLLNDYFDFIAHDRDTVYVDASLSKDERWKYYSSNTRNILRRCYKDLVLRKTTDIESFITLYRATMEKNSAEEFYYFDKEYFKNLLLLDNAELYEVLYEDKVISGSFFIFGEDFGHYHLSANDYEYKKHNANYFILDSIFDISREKGKRIFHLGGGRCNDKDDALLKFKQKFSPLTKEFYIAGKIYNKEIYDRYVKMWESQTDKDIRYFLKYRLEL
jgi:lipid II:glycine glycyltransferase (peptidoglycan interpeptide bridge formation enzyme)